MRIPVQYPITMDGVLDWFVAFQNTGHAVNEIRMPKKAYTRVQKVCRELIFDENYMFGATLVKDNNLSNEVEIVGFI